MAKKTHTILPISIAKKTCEYWIIWPIDSCFQLLCDHPLYRSCFVSSPLPLHDPLVDDRVIPCKYAKKDSALLGVLVSSIDLLKQIVVLLVAKAAFQPAGSFFIENTAHSSSLLHMWILRTICSAFCLPLGMKLVVMC